MSVWAFVPGDHTVRAGAAEGAAMIPQLRWVAALWLAVLVLWAPLPFGSAPAWAVGVLQSGAAAALFVAAWAARSDRRLRAVGKPFALLLALAVLGLVQSLPVPRVLATALSPGHAHLSAAAGEVAGSAWTRLSLSPDLSRRTSIWLLALAAAFVAAAMVSERRLRRRALFGAVLASALFQAAFGLRERLALRRTIWGVEVPQPPGRLRGSFINPDHAAFLLLLALAVSFAWIWWAVRSGRWRGNWDSWLMLGIVPVATWLALLAALLLTGSRSALAAGVVGTLVQASLLARGRRRWWVVGAAVLLLAVGVATTALLAFDLGFGRLADTTGYELIRNDRWIAYAATLELWSRFPIFGTGLGSFRDAFPMVQPEGLHEVWRHAHSDWLELLATTGVVGLGLALGAVLLVARRFGVQLTNDRRSEDRAGAIAGIGMLSMAAVHSLLDFSLTMPADAFILAVALGCAAGAPAPRMREPSRRSHGGRQPSPGRSANEPDVGGMGTLADDGEDFDQMRPGIDPSRDRDSRTDSHGANQPAVQPDLHGAAGH
jgi:O-antigen ligase